MPGSSFGACPLRAYVDPRLLRFSAGATASVLAVVLLIVDIARPLGLGLLASQVAVFAFTAFVSFQWSLWAQIFARVIWPRIGAPAELGGCSAAEIRPIRRLRVYRPGADHLCTRRRYRWLRPHRSRLRRGSPQRSHRAVFGLQGLPADPPTETSLSLVEREPTTRPGATRSPRRNCRGRRTAGHLRPPDRGELWD